MLKDFFKKKIFFVQLSLLILGCWSCYPILWLFCDGARALSSDAALSLYTCLDLLSHCICGLMLVRNIYASPDFFEFLNVIVL